MIYSRQWSLLWLTGVVLFLPATYSWAEDWQQIDLEGFLRRHPLMQSFDRARPGFRGTPSEARDPQQLQAEISVLDRRLQALNQAKRPMIDPSALFPGNSSPAGEETWKRIRQIDQERETIQKQRNALHVLLQNGGVPPRQTLVMCIRNMMSDQKESSQAGSQTIVLNTLPRFSSLAPTAEVSLRECFLTPSPSRWQRYVKAARFWYALFPSLHRTILYRKGTLPR
jgi:hypothetical protein